MAICNSCGQEVYRYTVRIGEETESIECLKCGRHGAAYQPFKAYLDNNIDEKPVFIESDRQREKIMRQRGLVVREREHIDDLNHRRWTKGLPPLEK